MSEKQSVLSPLAGGESTPMESDLLPLDHYRVLIDRDPQIVIDETTLRNIIETVLFSDVNEVPLAVIGRWPLVVPVVPDSEADARESIAATLWAKYCGGVAYTPRPQAARGPKG